MASVQITNYLGMGIEIAISHHVKRVNQMELTTMTTLRKQTFALLVHGCNRYSELLAVVEMAMIRAPWMDTDTATIILKWGLESLPYDLDNN